MSNGPRKEGLPPGTEPAMSLEERLRYEREMGFRYPIDGEDLIKELGTVELEKLPALVEEALAFREGLPFGVDDYDLDNPETLLGLQTLFSSCEGMRERPSPYYIDTAIRERIRKEIRQIKKGAHGKEKTEEEEKKEKGDITQLERLENHREARKLIDAAFVQRTTVCEQGEAVSELLGPAYVKPDKGHWQAALSGEFGEKVDRVLRRIVAAGFEEDKLKVLKKRIVDGWKLLENGDEADWEEDTGREDVKEEVVGLKKRLKEKGWSDERVKEEISRLDQDLKPVPDLEAKDAIYATGFVEREDFRRWLFHLLEAAGKRMDIVWFAWRLALLWELPAQFGAKVSKKKIWKKDREGQWVQVFKKDEQGRQIPAFKEKMNIADPPIGNDLFTWTMHLEAKRYLEWGYRPDGERARLSKYLTHTGYPLSLGRIDALLESFLHESKVDEPDKDGPPEKTKKVSLWQLWWREGMKVGGDDPEKVKNILPWSLTEMQPRGLDTEEFGTGSFGLWRLNGLRAFLVSKDIRSRPSLRDLSDPDFFASRLRNWEKVLGVMNKEKEPEENPRTWWVAGLLFAHYLGRTKEAPLANENPELAYRTVSPGETWSHEKPGVGDNRPISADELFMHARSCGFLREKDENWLRKKLNIKRRGTL